MRLLDVIGVTLWLGVGIKAFVDWDRLLVDALAPDLAWIVNFRWLIILMMAALLLLLFDLKLGAGLAYVVFFPLIVIFWKFPRLILKHRSLYVFYGLMVVATTILGRIRRFFVSLVATIFSATLVVVGEESSFWWIGLVGLFGVTGWVILTACLDLIRSPTFIRAQEKAARGVLGWGFLEALVAPPPPDQLSLTKWKRKDAEQYRDGVGNSLLIRDGLRFAAFSMNKYRSGPAITLVNVATTLLLFVQIIAFFTFMNLAVFRIAPADFAFTRIPDLATFVYYSSSALYFGEISALVPLGSLAVFVKFVNGFVGVVLLGAILLATLLTYRSNRADAISSEVVSLLNGKVAEFDELAMGSFQLPREQLEERLASVGWGLLSSVRWLRDQVDSEK